MFSSIYPMSTDEYPDLTKALEKLAINDAALTFEKDSSAALGFGFRCGFLGLLHLDVIQERLQREFDLGLVISAPSVNYKIQLRDGTTIDVDNPSYWPDPMSIDKTTEPYIKAAILIPEEYVGPVMELCREHRSDSQTMNYLSAGRVEVKSEMPLGEVLFDFYGKPTYGRGAGGGLGGTTEETLVALAEQGLDVVAAEQVSRVAFGDGGGRRCGGRGDIG